MPVLVLSLNYCFKLWLLEIKNKKKGFKRANYPMSDRYIMHSEVCLCNNWYVQLSWMNKLIN